MKAEKGLKRVDGGLGPFPVRLGKHMMQKTGYGTACEGDLVNI